MADKRVIELANSRGVFDPLTYGACEEKYIFEKQAEEFGYERQTTFFSDLSIAEWYGLDGVRDTYNRVCKEWISDVKYFTEFVMALNWKCWEWHGRGYNELAQLYSELYSAAYELGYEKYKDDDEKSSYFWRTLD